MKITKTASGTKKITMSKNEWQQIGKQAGWVKIADSEARLYKLVDGRTYKTLDTKTMTHQEHVELNRWLRENGHDEEWKMVKDKDPESNKIIIE
jgi:hypothetical protein